MAKQQAQLLPASSGPFEVHQTGEQIEQAKRNLVMCLNALEQKGEEGLEKALDRIYPPTGPGKDLRSVYHQGPGGIEMHALMSKQGAEEYHRKKQSKKAG